MRIDDALRLGVERLSLSETPQLDAELLLAHLLGRDRTYLYTWNDRLLDAPLCAAFEALLARRQQGEPIAHLTGVREFWSLPLRVTPDTLIPRPDTELLVETLLELLPATPATVVDLGTGSGAIACALASERPRWQLLAIDRSPACVAVAKGNAEQFGLVNVEVRQGDWCAGLSGPFQAIVSNPPYIDAEDHHLTEGDVRFEPRTALVADEQGLADLRRIAEQARPLLAPDAWLWLEHGWQQAPAVRELLQQLGYQQVHSRTDLAGHERITGGCWGG